MKKEYILITGGTSGIGYALAQGFAAQGKALVLVARNPIKLQTSAQSLQKDFNVPVVTLSQDLSQGSSAEEIFLELKTQGLVLSGLVNCAGFNEVGHFHETSHPKEREMLRVLMETPMNLCKAFIQAKMNQGPGMIVNVCSTGSFFPTPNNAVYCAAKGFLYQFTQAIRHELRKTNIRIFALCPGGTKTDFLERAKITDRRLFHIFPMSSERVAKVTLRSIKANRGHIVPGLYNKILVACRRFSPLWMTNRLADWMYQVVN